MITIIKIIVIIIIIIIVLIIVSAVIISIVIIINVIIIITHNYFQYDLINFETMIIMMVMIFDYFYD